MYAILGDTAAPGGQLFQLVLLSVVAHLGGWLISLTTLPRLIGMLLVGILFQVGSLIFFRNKIIFLKYALRLQATN